ncbi:MAG: hypothetical protein ACFFAK_05170 [Promethearchaeota archaeon]
METKIRLNGIDAEKPSNCKEVIKKDKIENYNGSIWLEKKTFRIALISTFSGLAVALGYALITIPNIELFTLMIFLGGFILGKKDGLIIGLLSSFIFVFFNPWGTSQLPLFTYQITHYSLTGFLGGVMQNFLKKKDSFKPKEDLYTLRLMILFGFIGLLITLMFDIISTLIGSLINYGFNIEPLILSYISGIPFTLAHLIGNTLGFIFILPGLISLIYKLLD